MRENVKNPFEIINADVCAVFTILDAISFA